MKSFERKERFFISGQENSLYADVFLAGMPDLELHIKGARLTISGEAVVTRNGVVVTSKALTVERGDTIGFCGYAITFFDDWLEVEGELTGSDIRLMPHRGEQGRFDDYPYYKRSPRVIYLLEEEKIEIKEPPQKKEMAKSSIFQMIIPSLSTAAFTVCMGILMKRGLYVYMSLGVTIITIIFSVKNFITERREIKKENKKRAKVYEEYLIRMRKRIRKARKKEQEALAYQFPKPKLLGQMLTEYSSRLYERSAMDEDFLQVNLGYFEGNSTVKVTYQKDEIELDKDPLKEMAKAIPREYKKVPGFPVAVDLKKAHLGFVGSKKNVHEQLKLIFQQLSFYQSYRELQIVFIHHEAYREEFSFVRWYPHLRMESIGVTCQVCTAGARDQIMGSIQQILKDRKLRQEEEQQAVTFTPHMLFVIDEPALILNHPVMEYLQRKEHNLGFSLIYTTDQQENLPENVHTVCLLENAQDGRLLLNEGQRINQRFTLSHVEDMDLNAMARKLSAIVHVQGMSSQIPEAITFFEMYQVEHPEELNVANRWAKNQSHKSLAVPLGVRAKNDYVELNLHEKAHGPHGLVAGTTGSGKSEIVQSYILSLAVNFHPHEVGFLLIDYKGGGMANLFAKLPHLLGTITNLDKAESMRAMASIKSELARRQQIFSDNNVNHINGYSQLFKLGKVAEPLPHLFLISDEFAELKKEQPEFMAELVSAARIGRSLGIHLILATQKPSGVVDDQIWTNSKFKLCLKVQNEGDSKEMLKTPDAASITQAGRSYLQVGNNEIYELFQSAWSGASYQKEQTVEEKEDDRVYLVNEIGQGVLLNQDLSGPKDTNQIKATQLDVVVEHLHAVYHSQEQVAVKKPWLPSLPDMMLSPYTKEVGDSATFQKFDLTLGLGMIDLPEEQVQKEYVLDLIKNGHLLYMASSGYGKSMLLGHIILGLSMKNAVRNLNLYLLDLGNSALIPYKGLPHVADYLGVDDTEKMDKFKRLILETISKRKKLLARAMAQNFQVYNQTQKEPLKAIVLLVDNYDTVGEIGDGLIAFLQKAAKDGAGLGIYLITTLTRDGAMRAATKGSFKERIAGFNFVEGENHSFLGRSQIQLSEDQKGRALVKQDGIHLMQLYAPVNCEDELAYNQQLKDLIAQVAAASTEERAKGVPVLPEVLRYEMLPQYPGYREDPALLPVGIDMDTLDVKYLELKETPALIVGGTGTGKTNAVKTLLHQAKGQPFFVFDNEDSMLRIYAGQEGVTYANTKEEARALMQKLGELIGERKGLFQDACVEDPMMNPQTFIQMQKPVYIVVDDLPQIYEMVGDNALFDQLAEALKFGCSMLITWDVRKKKPTSSAFVKQLESPLQGLILGSIKEQNLFPNSGFREDTRRIELGYHHIKGTTCKVQLIENE